jgi:cbb3-type cytochrome oxidase subunit 3
MDNNTAAVIILAMFVEFLVAIVLFDYLRRRKE